MRFNKPLTMTIAVGALALEPIATTSVEGEMKIAHSTSVVYLTHYDTVTSCHPTVTDCPVIVTSFVEASTTVCPVTTKTSTFTVGPTSPVYGFTTSPAHGVTTSPARGASTSLFWSTVPAHSSRAYSGFSFSELVPPYSTYPGYSVNSTVGSPAGTGSSGFPSPSNGSVNTSPMPAAPTESVVPYMSSAAGVEFEMGSILVALLVGAGVLFT